MLESQLARKSPGQLDVEGEWGVDGNMTTAHNPMPVSSRW